MVEGSFRPAVPNKFFYKSASDEPKLEQLPVIPPRPQMAPKLPLKHKSTRLASKPTESTVYPREDNIFTSLKPKFTLFPNPSSSSSTGLPIDFNAKSVVINDQNAANIIGLNQGRAALYTADRKLVISDESCNRQLYELIEIEGRAGEFIAFQDAGNVLRVTSRPSEAQQFSITMALRSCIPMGTCKILGRPEVGEIWAVGMREIAILMLNKEGEVALLQKGLANSFQDAMSIYFISSEDLVALQRDRTVNIYSIARFDHKPALIAKLPAIIGDLIRVFKLDSRSFASVYADGKIIIWRQDGEGGIKEKITIQATLFRIQSAVKILDALWLGLVNGKILVIQLVEDHAVVQKILSEAKIHSAAISKMIVSSKDLQLASIDSTGQLCIWDSSLSLYKQNLSLWSREADYCRYERVSVRICSWNVAAQSPIDCDRTILLKWLKGEEGDLKEDVVVISLQEIVDLNAKSLLIGGSSGNGGSNGASQTAIDQWAKVIKMCLNDFELVHCSAMVGLGLIIFSRTCVRGALSSVSADSVKTGLGGLHGNKGGLCWRAFIHDLPVAFVACHLAAGQAAVNERNGDFATILRGATFSSEARDAFAFPSGNNGNRLFDHSVIIVAGDLNYRIEMDRSLCLDRIGKGEKEALLESDQLANQMRRQELLLSYFREKHPDFAPTYKYDRGSIARFDSSEKARVPAWCDRILHYSKVPESVIMRAYKSIQEATLSDHKPIYSVIELKCRRIDPVARENIIKNLGPKYQ